MVIFASLFFSAILSKIFSTVKQGKEYICPRISGSFTNAMFLNAAGKAKDMLVLRDVVSPHESHHTEDAVAELTGES